MPDSTAVLTALRDELLERALVRRPGDAGDLPPAFVEPRGGPPAPHDRADDADAGARRETDNDLVVTLRLSSELSAAGPRARYRTVIVDVVYRSTGTDALK